LLPRDLAGQSSHERDPGGVSSSRASKISRGRASDKAWPATILLYCGGARSCRAALRSEGVFAGNRSRGTLQAVPKGKEQLRQAPHRIQEDSPQRKPRRSEPAISHRPTVIETNRCAHHYRHYDTARPKETRFPQKYPTHDLGYSHLGYFSRSAIELAVLISGTHNLQAAPSQKGLALHGSW
jgi:hypothetical protein